MTIEELYERIGGDYAEAISRLRMDKLISKFVIKFLDDSTCRDLVECWRSGDVEGAFHAAHSAKGVCMNLALPKLAVPADAITEALRPGNDELRASTDVDALVNELEQAYQEAVEGIDAYKAEL